MKAEKVWEDKLVPTYCLHCRGGPDLIKIHVVNGVAVGIEPNHDFDQINPGEGKGCVKAQGLIQKHYNPHRIKGPMKRTNPKKGIDEDPKWVEITWEEALDLVAKKLAEARDNGLIGENGYPRVACSEGSDGIAVAYDGTFNILFGYWQHVGRPPGVFGPTDFGLTSAVGPLCTHTEHCLGERWHKAFICNSDHHFCRYEISFGKNVNATTGPVAMREHAEAKLRGYKRVQVEPHLSVTGATAAEWISIKPETDSAFLYAMLHVVLYEMDWRKVCDIEHLKKMTNSPYLVAPNGYFLREDVTKKPLIWDPVGHKAKVFDAEDINDVVLEGEYMASGITAGPDGKTEAIRDAKVKPSHQLLIEHMKDCTPDWASKICEVPAEIIRRLTREFVENAMVGAIVKVDGAEMPLRPVTITLGRDVNNGPGSMQCLWAKHVLEALFGAIEVPGSDRGGEILISGGTPFARSPDGFLEYPFHPTDKERWKFPPGRRDGVPSLCPLIGPFLGPTYFAWKWSVEPPENWPKPPIPDVFISYRTNPMLSQLDTPAVSEVLKRIPFHVAILYSIDEMAWFADVLLPEDGDLEHLQLFPVGGVNAEGNFWGHSGMFIKQPAVKRAHDTMNITDMITELAERVGLLAVYNEAINQGEFYGIRLKNTPYEIRLDKKYTNEELMDRWCKAFSSFATGGKAEYGLAWFKQNGGMFAPYPKIGKTFVLAPGVEKRPWYLYPAMKEMNIRFELPYQERMKRIGEELEQRLHEKGIYWWDRQAKALQQALPKREDGIPYLDEVAKRFGKDPEDYPFWLLSAKSHQHSFGLDVDVPIIHEVSSHVLDQTRIQINRKAAEKLQIKDGDEVWLESPYGKIKGKVKLREGIRPDCLLLVATYGHWVTPFAKELGIPNRNSLIPAILEIADELGGAKGHTKVKIYKA